MNNRLATNSNIEQQIHDNLTDTSMTPKDAGVMGYQSENTFEERREITNFTEDQEVVSDSLAGMKNLPREMYSHGSDVREHTVKSFLRRPEKIATVSWTTSDAQMTNLVSIAIPSDVLTSMYRSKLLGFGLLRADIVFKIQLNSQPFQAGRLLMTYTPVPNYLRDRYAMTRSSLTRLTSLPNVTLDISKQTEINITIPYVNSLTHYNLIYATGDWAQFDIWVYSPLMSESDQTVNLSVRTYLDNVELGALTQLSLATAEEMAGISAEAQSAGSTEGQEKVTIQEQTAGPVSQIGQLARKVIAGATIPVTKNIPIIGNVVKNVNGAAASILNLFANFGLGKPTNIEKATPVVIDATRFFCNSDGVDNGHIMTLRAANQIEPLPGFAGSEVDELSLKYLMQTLQYIDSFTITTDNAVGDAVWTSKNTLWKEDLLQDRKMTFATDTTYNYSAQPILQWYIGSNFTYWKGDIIYHITLVKTDYHSVRLKFVYDPMATLGTDIAYDSSEYCYSVVLDFRDKTDFYVRVPFVSSTPWKYVLPSDAAWYGGDNTTQTLYPLYKYDSLSTHSGSIALFIDNTLRASSVVTPNINCIVEMCAADNFELAAPMEGRNFSPVHGTNETTISAQAQSNFAVDGTLKPHSRMQLDTSDIHLITDTPPNYNNNEPPFTVGEQCNSIRMLIKRFNWVFRGITSNLVLPNEVVPLKTEIGTDETTGESIYEGPFSFECSLYDIFGSLYAFRTGGVRYKAIDISSEYMTAIMTSVNSTQQYTGVDTFTDFAALQGIGNTAPAVLDARFVKGSFEVTIPYYHLGYNKTNSFSTNTQFSSSTPIGHHYADSSNLVGLTRSNTSVNVFLAKSAADDSNFGFLLGVPDCIPQIVVQQTLNHTPVYPYLE